MRWFAPFFLIFSLFFTTSAFAQVSADELGFSVHGTAQLPKDHPWLGFKPSRAFSAVHFACKRSDGQDVNFSVAGLRPGAEKRLPLPVVKGVFHYTCKLSGQAGKEKFANFDVEFDTRVGEPPKIQIAPTDVDENGRKITVRLTEPAGRLELDVMGDDGKPIANVSKKFAGEAPGTPLTVTWTQKADEVVGQFQLRAYDQADYWSGIESVTFVDIPHQDVIFESGKWDIRPTEEPKLAEPLERIQQQLKAVAGVLQIELYIGGYTDTVGQAGDNLELSRKRAHAIATWFSAHGIKTPIQSQGFGETALKVPTADGVDEARNRRASYVLSVQPPPASRGFPARNWVRVK